MWLYQGVLGFDEAYYSRENRTMSAKKEESAKCKKCGKPKPVDNWTMCDECDWWYTAAILN